MTCLRPYWLSPGQYKPKLLLKVPKPYHLAPVKKKISFESSFRITIYTSLTLKEEEKIRWDRIGTLLSSTLSLDLSSYVIIVIDGKLVTFTIVMENK